MSIKFPLFVVSGTVMREKVSNVNLEICEMRGKASKVMWSLYNSPILPLN